VLDIKSVLYFIGTLVPLHDVFHQNKLHMILTLVLERREEAALLLQNNSGIHWLGWHVESVLTWWQ